MAETRIEVCLGGCEPKCGNCGVQVEVELTAQEIAELDQLRAQAAADAEARAAAEAAKAALIASAKAKLVAGQPLTAEEADVLVL
jgi:hypothetical protein